uniref:UV excision repair protein RAD23 n=1 Tax=Anopheles dirus TaxID=7168 RepID=A0A182N1C5_9DIPT
MKITLKTLKQETFFVEVDVEKDTVQTLKEKLCAESGQAYPVDRQRLIYLGKIMEDDHPLGQYNLDDKKFIVVMNKKTTPAAAPPTAAAADEPAAAASSEAKAPADAASADDKSKRPEAARTKAPEATFDTPSASSNQPATGTSVAAPASATTPSTDTVPQDVQVNIQRLVGTMLPHLMRRMQASNPDLLDIIAMHQEDFLALINEGTAAPAGRELSRELEDIAAAMVNSLTPSDMDAIERLKALGYPEHLVIQAYIACERDEYNAAEFLVSQTLDDDD